jgi:23S rRNA pseudouridine2605 synthase
MTLREGKNREIKQLLEEVGLQVTRLIRTAYGPFQLGRLPKGAVKEVPRRTLFNLLPGYFVR